MWWLLLVLVTFVASIGLIGLRHRALANSSKETPSPDDEVACNGSPLVGTMHEPDFRYTRDWLAEAAGQGHGEARFHLGMRHLYSGDRGAAILALQEAAEGGHIEAQYQLGILLRNESDFERAERWLKEAADAGHVEAQYQLASLLLRNSNRLEEANRRLRLIGERHVETQFHLGISNADGGATQNLERAANAGHADAQFMLGLVRRRQGRFTEAEDWWRRAAERSNSGAMFYLGMLRRQRGETSGAREWLHRATQMNHREAMFHLGLLHRDEGARGEAQLWLRRAAEAGHVDAMFNLAMLDCRQPPSPREEKVAPAAGGSLPAGATG